MGEIRTVRAFSLPDVPFVRRLATQGISLDAVTALTRGVNPINEAFLAALPVGDLGMPTYVLRENDTGLIGLLRHREGSPQAYIAYIAPDLDRGADPILWLEMVEGLVQAAGARGAHILNVEVDPGSLTFMALRDAGFAIFARQEVWRRQPVALPVGKPPAPMLRACTDADQVSVTTLYVNTVPHLVQQAIPPPEAGEHGLVHLNEAGHAAGHFSVYEGQRGLLLRPLLHPEAYEHAADLLDDALVHLPQVERIPAYCAVHRYQEWLREALSAADFTPWAHQVVMGKYTLRRVKAPAFEPLPVHPLAILEKKPPIVPGAGAKGRK